MKINQVKIVTEPAAQLTEGESVAVKAILYADNQSRTNDDGSLKLEYLEDFKYEWTVSPGDPVIREEGPGIARWTPTSAGEYTITLSLSHDDPESKTLLGLPQPTSQKVSVGAAPGAATGPVAVKLTPPSTEGRGAEGFLQAILESTGDLDFKKYQAFVDQVMCQGKFDDDANNAKLDTFNRVRDRRTTVFPGVDAYQKLKVATEVYLMLSVRVVEEYDFRDYDEVAHEALHGYKFSLTDLRTQWADFLHDRADPNTPLLPIDRLIRNRLNGSTKTPAEAYPNGDVRICEGLLQEKLKKPCFLELIWSYWQEEGMLVQTMKAIARRFQNQRTSERDPLASFDVAPLYPLSNLLWGYIQDEQHRLTLPRRAYEYDHHYGITLEGKAVSQLRSADSRSKFLEAFHNLLYTAQALHKLIDDMTKRADGFPVLNALKEVHLLLREGMHNQYGDLPSTARIEMLMEQWILARPEMKEFLGGRAMMPYAEGWMDRVDTMKKLKGWSDVSVTYFSELAKFGEFLLTSIRHFDWSNMADAALAVEWAQSCRSAIQQYVHNYRTVTGVDLSLGQTDVRLAADRYIQPSVHLRKRLDAQRRVAAPSGFGSPRRAGAASGRDGSDPGLRQTRTSRGEMEYSEEF